MDASMIYYRKLQSDWRRVYHWLYCQTCMVNTDHEIEEHGEWEVYTCRVCGGKQEYRVR